MKILRTIVLSSVGLLLASPVHAACGSDFCTSRIERIIVYANGNVIVRTNEDTTPLSCDANVADPTTKNLWLNSTEVGINTVYSTLLTAEATDLQVQINVETDPGNNNCLITSVATLNFD